MQFHSFTATGGKGAGAGTYTFYTFYKEPFNEDDSSSYTKVLANHNADPAAILTKTDGSVAGPINHFHAGIIPNKVLGPDTPNPWNIVYNKVDTAAEHYFDASSI